MKLRKIDPDNQKDRNSFIDLPFEIYKDCPQWVPPIKKQMHFVMNRQIHPFYQHSNADFFVLEDGNQVISRIALINHKNFSQFHNQPTGFFYYFDSINDDKAASMLFDTALDWYRKENLTTVLGPKGFIRSDWVGQLVQGFENPAGMGSIYNFPYYNLLLEKAGFVKETDHYTGYIERGTSLPEKMYKAADRVISRNGFAIKSFTSKDEMHKWISRLEEVHHVAFANNIGFYPSTSKEFQLLAENLFSVVEPQTAKLIMKGDEIAGFILAYPEISNGLRKSKGELYPLGWWHLLRDKKNTQFVTVSVIGLLPKYQGLGGNILLFVELDKTLRSMHFEKAEFTQIDERNPNSFNAAVEMGVTWNIIHRTFRYDL
jgi:hypothetical protein